MVPAIHCLESIFFFFNDTATTEIYTLSLHDALPIWRGPATRATCRASAPSSCTSPTSSPTAHRATRSRSEEHTSELQSQSNLVCRLLLEKKNKTTTSIRPYHLTTHPTRASSPAAVQN